MYQDIDPHDNLSRGADGHLEWSPSWTIWFVADLMMLVCVVVALWS